MVVTLPVAAHREPPPAHRRRGAVRSGLGGESSAIGYEVDSATSGAAGLAKAATSAHDIIVLDLGLPDMDGLEVLKGIRAWSTVPVIVLSARDTETKRRSRRSMAAPTIT